MGSVENCHPKKYVSNINVSSVIHYYSGLESNRCHLTNPSQTLCLFNNVDRGHLLKKLTYIRERGYLLHASSRVKEIEATSFSKQKFCVSVLVFSHCNEIDSDIGLNRKA